MRKATASMKDVIERDLERAARLVEFLKGEAREMYTAGRFRLTQDLVAYLKPEIDELIRQGKTPYQQRLP